MKKEQKCKDEDDYKDYDKEKCAKRIIETLGVVIQVLWSSWST